MFIFTPILVFASVKFNLFDDFGFYDFFYFIFRLFVLSMLLIFMLFILFGAFPPFCPLASSGHRLALHFTFPLCTFFSTMTCRALRSRNVPLESLLVIVV